MIRGLRTAVGRSSRVGRLSVLVALLATACAGPSAPGGATAGSRPAAEPVVVAGSFPESGPAAVAAAAGRGMAAALARANESGGVGGRPIRWTSYDDGYDPARMAGNARRAVEQDAATVFVSFGAPSTTVRPYLNERKVFHLALAGSSTLSDVATYPYTHAWFPDTAWEASVDVAQAKADQPSVTLGILGLNNDIPDSAAAGARRAGVTPALVLKVPPSQVDVRSQVTQLKAAGVTAVLLVGSPVQVINAVRYMRLVRYQPVIFVNSVSAGRKDTLDPLGSAAIGIRSAFWLADPADPLWNGDPSTSRFALDVKGQGHPEDADAYLAMMGYAAGEALVNALRSATGPDAGAVNDAWNATKGLSVTGSLDGITLDATAGTGRLVHAFQPVRFTAAGWQVTGPAVDAVAAGYVD